MCAVKILSQHSGHKCDAPGTHFTNRLIHLCIIINTEHAQPTLIIILSVTKHNSFVTKCTIHWYSASQNTTALSKHTLRVILIIVSHKKSQSLPRPRRQVPSSTTTSRYWYAPPPPWVHSHWKGRIHPVLKHDSVMLDIYQQNLRM